ncbi:MAG: hypothetical protein NZM29_00600 [Nitrospira sp.]|nr:hypothetical protein [Nitrospira sp.]
MRTTVWMLMLGLAMSVLARDGDLRAEPRADDRIALTLSGADCAAHRDKIAQRLYQIPGVKHVDMDLIEGHVLIDRLRNHLTIDDFKAIVNEVIPPGSQCLAEFIEGCISAGPMTSNSSVDTMKP